MLGRCRLPAPEATNASNVENPGLRMRQQRVDEQDRRGDHQDLFHRDDQSTTIQSVREDATVQSEDDQGQQFHQPMEPTSSVECVRRRS
jgi:hypothetical protein